MRIYVPDPGLVVGGLVITLAVAGVARWFGMVSTTGFLAGLSIGGWVSLGLGSPGLVVVGAFFVMGSLATRWRYAEKEKRGVAEPGGGARGAGRVLAKGSIGAALAVAALFGDFDPVLVRAAFVGSFAAAAADTLGTEIGQVVGRNAFTLVPFGPAKPGTPGAVSFDGLLAGFLGSAAVAGCAVAAGHDLLAPVAGLPVAAAGLLGSVVESALAPVLRKIPARDLTANLVTTAAGAALAALAVALIFPGAAAH
jgi:uncharacterized protein (TIGR00297 family)